MTMVRKISGREPSHKKADARPFLRLKDKGCSQVNPWTRQPKHDSRKSVLRRVHPGKTCGPFRGAARAQSTPTTTAQGIASSSRFNRIGSRTIPGQRFRPGVSVATLGWRDLHHPAANLLPIREKIAVESASLTTGCGPHASRGSSSNSGRRTMRRSPLRHLFARSTKLTV